MRLRSGGGYLSPEKFACMRRKRSLSTFTVRSLPVSEALTTAVKSCMLSSSSALTNSRSTLACSCIVMSRRSLRAVSEYHESARYSWYCG